MGLKVVLLPQMFISFTQNNNGKNGLKIVDLVQGPRLTKAGFHVLILLIKVFNKRPAN